ncbi:hypothetical protein N7528_006049 [Penicillium herquei]|nr:hypothetical protein N7528_006049 [Penicillium herquei]
MATTDEIKHLADVAAAATWPFCALATILFFMRVFSVWRLKNEARTWEDLVLAISWMMEIIQAAIFQKQLDYAKALDLTRQPETVPNAVFWALLMNDWSYFSIEFPKIAVALLATNLFRAGRWSRVAIWSLCILVNVMAIGGFIITWVMCDPVAGQWNPWKHPNVKCWPRAVQIKYACVTCAFSSLFNIALCVYPATVVWHLQMPRWKKVSTIGLTGLGLVAFIFSIVKLWALTKLVHSPGEVQLIYDSEELGIWNRIENDFVLMVGLLPFAPAFFKTFNEFTRGHISGISQRLSSNKSSSFGSRSDQTHVLKSMETGTENDESNASLFKARNSLAESTC